MRDALPTAGCLPRVHSSLNIAEGSGKTTEPDRRRFMAIARGSAMECAAILDACEALRLVEEPTADEANRTLVGIVQMLSRMCSG